MAAITALVARKATGHDGINAACVSKRPHPQPLVLVLCWSNSRQKSTGVRYIRINTTLNGYAHRKDLRHLRKRIIATTAENNNRAHGFRPSHVRTQPPTHNPSPKHPPTTPHPTPSHATPLYTPTRTRLASASRILRSSSSSSDELASAILVDLSRSK